MNDLKSAGVAALDKRFICEGDLLLDGYRLGRKIVDDGFRPDFIVGIWRGGSSVGIVVQECLQYFGIETDHLAIRTSYRGLHTYDEMIGNADRIRVHGMSYLEERLCAEHRLLLVDDVHGSGASIRAVRNRLHRKLRANTPEDIRSASVWFRPPFKDAEGPDYFVHQTDQWLVLPYELSGLSREEIAQNKAWVASKLDRVDAFNASK